MTLQVIRRRSLEPPLCAKRGGANYNNCSAVKQTWRKLICRHKTHARDAPGVLGWERASLSGRLISGRADRWLTPTPTPFFFFLHKPPCLKPQHNEYLHGSSPKVSGSAKLERRHKTEATLIDYLELICILRAIMGAGNRTNTAHGRQRWILMMFLIMVSSPPAAEEISKGLSSQIWTMNERTWSRGSGA